MKSPCLVLWASFPLLLLAESAVSACEQKVLEKVERCGLHIGYDAVRGEFVSVQHAFFDCKDSAGPALQLLRERAFDEALSKARLEIAGGMRSEVTGSNSVRGGRNGESSCKVVESAFATESHDVLLGLEIIAMSEDVRSGRYCIAMAVAWGEARERAAVRSFSGRAVPARDWKDQLRASVRSFGGCVPRLNSFTDSSGFVHCYAASVSDVSSVPTSLRGVRVAQEEAKALRRLQLWRDGRTKSGVRLDSALEKRKGESSRLRREQRKGSDSEAFGALPGMICIFEGEVPGFRGGCALHALVYALEPDGALPRPDMSHEDKGFSGGSVKVFNPATGKYEEVCK